VLTSQDVASAQFTPVKWREGYEIDEVRLFLATVVETLTAHEYGHTSGMHVTAAQVTSARFAVTKFREGWEQNAVDAYLDQIAATLTAHENSRP
jgi:DivIVA domain-containing protein